MVTANLMNQIGLCLDNFRNSKISICNDLQWLKNMNNISKLILSFRYMVFDHTLYNRVQSTV